MPQQSGVPSVLINAVENDVAHPLVAPFFSTPTLPTRARKSDNATLAQIRISINEFYNLELQILPGESVANPESQTLEWPTLLGESGLLIRVITALNPGLANPLGQPCESRTESGCQSSVET